MRTGRWEKYFDLGGGQLDKWQERLGSMNGQEYFDCLLLKKDSAPFIAWRFLYIILKNSAPTLLQTHCVSITKANQSLLFKETKEVNVELCLCLIKHQAMRMYGGAEVPLHVFSTFKNWTVWTFCVLHLHRYCMQTGQYKKGDLVHLLLIRGLRSDWWVLQELMESQEIWINFPYQTDFHLTKELLYKSTA
jgi:hypothetical protein